MNEALIRDVFNKMASFKPSLNKYLISDEPGEGSYPLILSPLGSYIGLAEAVAGKRSPAISIS